MASRSATLLLAATAFIAQVSLAAESRKGECLSVIHDGVIPQGSWLSRPPNSYYVLSREQVTALSEKALEGSADAALRLGLYHVLTVDPYSKAGPFWLQIAVENGSREAMYRLGSVLIESHELQIKKRGRYWLLRTIAECDGAAKTFAKMAIEEHEGDFKE